MKKTSVKRKILRAVGAVIFCLIFLYLFVHLTYVLNPNDDDHRKEMVAGFYKEEENSIDVVFFGSSAVNEFYAPALMWGEYGFTSYLFSNATQKPEYTTYLIEEVLKTQSPELLVIEPRIFLYSPGATQQEDVHYFNRLTIDNLKYSLNHWKLIGEQYADYTSIEDYLPIIRYHENWKDFKAEDLKYWNDEAFDENKGFLFYEEHTGKVKPQEYVDRSEDTEAWPIAEEREKQLREVLEFCAEKGVKVLVAVSPYCVGSEDHKYYNYIGQIAEEYGQYYLDLNRYAGDMGLDYSVDFYNDMHVNIDGVYKVSRYMSACLKYLYGVGENSSYSESVVTSWNEAYNEWSATAQEYMEQWQFEQEIYGESSYEE